MIEDPRDQALFNLTYLYGLRVGEVELLERRDVDFARNRIVIKRLKGGISAEQPLFSGCRKLLERVLPQEDGDSPSSPLFPGRLGPLRKRQIQSRFARYRDLARLPEYLTTHSLRHSIATHLRDAGMSLEFVQEYLGHRDIRSTTIYARISDQRRVLLFDELERSPWIVLAERPPDAITSAEQAA